jgi:hypothetical protein
MSCCGQGRSAYKAATGAGEIQAGEAVTPRTIVRVLVRYRATAPVTVRGVATGAVYEFDGQRQRQLVAQADAAALLRSRSFERAD